MGPTRSDGKDNYDGMGNCGTVGGSDDHFLPRRRLLREISVAVRLAAMNWLDFCSAKVR